MQNDIGQGDNGGGPQTPHRFERGQDFADRAKDATTGFLGKLWTKIGRDNIALMAAGVAFYCFLSLVPLLAAVILTYGLIADPATVADHIRTIVTIVPHDAAKLILDQLMAVVNTSSGKTGFGLLLALLIAIYSATRASTAIMAALSVIYGQQDEARGFIMGTFVSMAIIVGAVGVAITGLLAATVLGWLQTLLDGLGPVALFAIKLGTWAIAALLASAAIGGAYRFGPNRPPNGWQWISMGSGIATLLWLAATVGLGLYVSSFGNYNATYGSLSAVVVLLMWFYVSAYAILLGATINAVLWPQKHRRKPLAEAPAPAEAAR
ncbi:YihY/virulence factor BrkB family protein [Sphingomonas abietis]|uniref:YihY/virulence factor BrkB family protein n=1 Tax=Sphingomonas abietis TaxID=3012344 RepID=A0ABY7NRL2_9SPHN|nr:YihY/virulence factor BrkB family protein [Sphingomonas abietis]WBO24033.1 YihY/virulence factor BrkB family protein [Sphingomonas abietis]